VFLLVLMVFNTVGYYGILLIMECRMSDEMTALLDENGDEINGDLLLTFPLEVYTPDSPNYERTTGELNYEGQVYRLVKQKRYHGMLYMICVKDDNSTRVRAAMGEFSNTFTNQQPDNTGSAVKLVVSFAKYCIQTDQTVHSLSSGWSQVFIFSLVSDSFHFSFDGSVFHPPQLS
jgi:hypothetical protein